MKTHLSWILPIIGIVVSAFVGWEAAAVKTEGRMTAVETKIIDTRESVIKDFGAIDKRFDVVDGRFKEQATKLDGQNDKLDRILIHLASQRGK